MIKNLLKWFVMGSEHVFRIWSSTLPKWGVELQPLARTTIWIFRRSSNMLITNFCILLLAFLVYSLLLGLVVNHSHRLLVIIWHKNWYKPLLIRCNMIMVILKMTVKMVNLVMRRLYLVFLMVSHNQWSTIVNKYL